MSMQPLSLELSGTDLTPDRLPKGEYGFTIKSAEFVAGKVDGRYNLLTIYKLNEDAVSQRGNPISAGYEIRSYRPLQQSDNPKAPDFKVALTKDIMATFGIADVAEVPALNDELLAAMAGRPVILSLSLDDIEEFGPSNSVKAVKAVQ